MQLKIVNLNFYKNLSIIWFKISTNNEEILETDIVVPSIKKTHKKSIDPFSCAIDE